MKDILFLCIGFLYNMDMILVHVLFSKDFCQKSIEAVKQNLHFFHIYYLQGHKKFSSAMATNFLYFKSE